MCLAVPMRLDSIEGNVGTVSMSGVNRHVRLDLLDDLTVGQYVLVHAGFAIQSLDEAEAHETLRLLEEVLAHAD